MDHLCYLVDGHRDNAEVSDEMLLEIPRGGRKNGLGWPRGGAHRFVRGFGRDSRCVMALDPS